MNSTDSADVVGAEVPDALGSAYLSTDVPGVALRARSRPQDFMVEERLEREPLGNGPFVWLRLEKTGRSTREVAAALARQLGLGRAHVGFSGLKDANAVARQTFSLEGVEPERALGFSADGVRVLGAERDAARLRPGKLLGNRFRLRLRDVEAGGVERVRAVLDILARRGLPNAFGEQRFGVRGDGWRVGRALEEGRPEEALAWIAGRPGPADHGRVRQARAYYDRGLWAKAARTFPASLRDQVRICRALHRRGGDARRALRVLDRGLVELFLSAWQARQFNAVLAARMGTLDALLIGDWAWNHAAGNCALVDGDGDGAWAERARRFELSPSGPLPGRKAREASDAAGEIERRALDLARGASRSEPPRFHPWAHPGGRRPLRVPLADVGVEVGRDDAGDYLELAFALPSGAYATALLREVQKGRGVGRVEGRAAE